MVVECVESISALDMKDNEYEIIVVDDGAKLCIEDKLKKIFPDIIYIRQENAGPGAARNTGIEIANGTYIQFVDADDCLIADVYEKCVDQIKACSPDVLMFASSHVFCSTKKNVVWSGEMTGAQYMCKNNLHASPCEYVFRRELIGKMRFSVGIFHEDEEFTPKLIVRAMLLQYTKAVAYYYRIRENSTMTTRCRSFVEQRLEFMVIIISRLHSLVQELDGDRRKGMERKVAQLTMDYIYNVMRLYRSYDVLRNKVKYLRKELLYPLPLRCYTWKYLLFALGVNNKIGLWVINETIKKI